MNRIIYTNEDGSVAVVVPAKEFENRLDELMTKDVPEAAQANAEQVPLADIPTDRTFRNAWKRGEQGKRIGVDMVKAADISHEKRRAARAAEFAPLDIKATIPAEAAQAEADRQVVRDKYDAIQVSIDAATTPEELKAIVASLETV